MRENTFDDIYNRLRTVFTNRVFLSNLNNSKDNWLELPVDEVIDSILEFFKSLETIEV